MRTTIAVLCLLTILCLPRQAAAHYLWVTVDSQSGDHGRANIYFEESPSAGDGRYLDHFKSTSQIWLRTVASSRPQSLQPEDVRQDKQRWLRVELPATAPRSVDFYGKFGVYRYGNTDVLLHYYGRNLDVSTHEDLHELSRAEHMDLELIPHDEQDELELTVLWQKKPAAGRTVYIRGPQGFKQNIKTDQNGRARFTPVDGGRYTFRTSVEEATPGQDGGTAYSLIRHNGTLIMTLPLQK